MHATETDGGGSEPGGEVEIQSFNQREVREGGYLTVTDAVQHAGVRHADHVDSADQIPHDEAAVVLEYNFDPEMVPGFIEANPEADGRRSAEGRTRKIQLAGGDPDKDKHTFRITLPDRLFEQLGIDPDNPEGESIEVLAGDRLIAFRPPQTQTLDISAEAERSGGIDPVELLGPVASEDFRKVEIEGKHPAVVAEERGATAFNVVRNVREARDRLRELAEQGYEVDYDFNDPNVPDAVPGPLPLEPEADLPTANLDDGELQAELHAELTSHLSEHPDGEIATMVYEIIETSPEETSPVDAAATAVEQADRERLVDLYIKLTSTPTDAETGGDASGR